MNIIVYITGMMIVYFIGFIWGYVSFVLKPTGFEGVLMLILNSVIVMLGSYLIIVGLEPD